MDQATATASRNDDNENNTIIIKKIEPAHRAWWARGMEGGTEERMAIESAVAMQQKDKALAYPEIACTYIVGAIVSDLYINIYIYSRHTHSHTRNDEAHENDANEDATYEY